jgi:hypothetical protein
MIFDTKEVEISEKRGKVAVYARVSSDEQRESMAIETQEAFATRRFLTELLLDSITVSREDTTDGTLGSPILDITWNFNPPERDSVANTPSTCRTAREKRETMTVEAGGRRLLGSVS